MTRIASVTRATSSASARSLVSMRGASATLGDKNVRRPTERGLPRHKARVTPGSSVHGSGTNDPG